MSNNPASLVTTIESNSSSANGASNPQNLRPILGTPLNPPPQVKRYKNLETPPPTRLPSSSPTRQSTNSVTKLSRKPIYAFNPNNLVEKLKQLTTSQNSLSNEPVNISSGTGTKTMNTQNSSGTKTPSTIQKNSSAPSSGERATTYPKLNASNIKGKVLNFNKVLSATPPISIEELIKDDVAFTKAIADLIAYEQDTDGWADVKFLVQVDTEKEVKERSYNLMGGMRETPQEYVLRLSNKRKDYVNETYQRALDLLKPYDIDRDTFELSKTTTQCKIAGIDRKTTEIPCWMCGYGTNLFKNDTHQYNEGGVILSMCDPKKNQFECEHILPAALMAFLEYLANTTYPVTDNDMMNSLYAGSCAMCNKIKSNNLYIKNTGNDGNGEFVPDNDELMKDVVAFFSAIHGTTKEDHLCIDGEASIKKEDKNYYYTSIVTVNKGRIKRRYPNLIWAMLHKDLAPPIPSSSPKRRKTEDNIGSLTYYGDLDSVFNSLSNNGEPFKLILDRDLPRIPDIIQKRINVGISVEWIKARFNSMREKIQGICSLLNTRKAYWHEKYTQVFLETPNFIKRIVYEAQEDIQIIERIIEDNTRQLQANKRNERAKRRKEMAEQLLAGDRTIAIIIPDDPEARIRARTYAPQRIENELNTFEEMRARNEREERGAFPRRGSLNAIRRASAAPALPICNNKNKNKQGCSVQGGRHKSSTRKNRKSPKKNTRRK